MEISDIDKDFVNIIEYLDAKGFKPFASCDGVIENHSEDREASFYAYISFLKSERIIDLMAAFMTDEKFMVAISTPSEKDEYELYGNIITGNQYSVYFNNKQGENTKHLEQIVRDAIEEKLVISEEKKKNLSVLNQVLEEEDDGLSLDINFNTDYQPYMRKTGKTNVLTIGTKENKQNERKDMQELTKTLAEKYGLVVKSSELNERFDDSKEFITYWPDNSCAEYYFQDEKLPMVLDIIRYSRKIQSQLATFKIEEIDYDQCYEEKVAPSTQLDDVDEILTLMKEKEKLLERKEEAKKLLENYEKQLLDQVTHDET